MNQQPTTKDRLIFLRELVCLHFDGIKDWATGYPEISDYLEAQCDTAKAFISRELEALGIHNCPETYSNGVPVYFHHERYGYFLQNPELLNGCPVREFYIGGSPAADAVRDDDADAQ
ncbi:hypothetical protein HMPREF3227_02438 [Corynebacterium sp. CMW7794]|uniref:hypothetical protein n=1 Tax=Corynebacterium TaxID=1716 RepID=UPI00079B5411|nr:MULTISPECIES: hypothetical protein [Corynebacterium]KXI15476.1 hypothetical protein HMPREF3227_02438 [Corynebacterium sp. CMW7794]